MKKTHKFATTPGFGYQKPKEIEDAFDVVEYLNYWYADKQLGTDIRHYIAWAEHNRYATILYEKGIILEQKEIPPLEIGKFKAHITTSEDGLLEINYYD